MRVEAERVSDPGVTATALERAGFRPERVEHPEDAQGVATVLRDARLEGLGVMVLGAGGALPPLPPDGRFVALSTAGLDRVDVYEPGDLTFTAGAGVTLGVLAERLGAEDQWLPLDPPGGGRRTLGGVVASGRSGPLQAGFGGVRDQVLGLTVVTGDGRVLHLGGRVMKNVAGFDMVRLFVGSAGRLGVVVSASLRVFPAPRGERILLLGADGSIAERRRLLAAARAVATAPVVPASAGLVRSPREEKEEILVLRLQGSDAVADADQRTLEDAAGERFRRAEEPARWIARLAAHAAEGDLLFRHHHLPASLPARWEAMVETVPEASLHADVLSGTLRGSLTADGAEAAGKGPEGVLSRLRAVGRGGSGLSLLGVPVGMRGEVAPAGDGSSSTADGVAELERRLQAVFDPDGVLAPARFGR